MQEACGDPRTPQLHALPLGSPPPREGPARPGPGSRRLPPAWLVSSGLNTTMAVLPRSQVKTQNCFTSGRGTQCCAVLPPSSRGALPWWRVACSISGLRCLSLKGRFFLKVVVSACERATQHPAPWQSL